MRCLLMRVIDRRQSVLRLQREDHDLFEGTSVCQLVPVI
jgi:hypothetical protein